MAGLAHDAAHFFKFLFILVLYSLAMTLFVSSDPLCRHAARSLISAPHKELPARLLLPKWGRRDPAQRAVGTLSNDVRGLLRAPRQHPAGAALAAVDLSAEVLPRGAGGERGRLRADDPGHAAGRAGRRLGEPDHAAGACLR